LFADHFYGAVLAIFSADYFCNFLMSDKQTIFLVGDIQKQFAKQCIEQAPNDYVCLIKQKTRTLEQNALMWALLADLSKQVNWYGQKLTSDEWKDVLSASLKKQKVVPGIDGGFVVIGARTSQMTKREMSDMCELIQAFGAEQGVQWSEPQGEEMMRRYG
jgi:hypothetical protein